MSHGATVLVVDDDAEVIDTMREILGAEGHVVLSAKNGREALELTVSRRPDLVLLDLEMPEMDGRSYLHAVRNSAELAEIPVVILSGADDAGCVGAESVKKPLRLDTLLGLIARVGRAAP